MLAAKNAAEHHFLALLLCLVIVLVLGRLVGVVFRAIKQPVVIGEILIGIALGPSLLKRVWPSLHETLFSSADLPFFKLVASLGLVLFMFIVGMEVDLDVIRSSGKRAVVISLTSIAFPFLLGFGLLGSYLYQDHQCVPIELEPGDKVAAQCASPTAAVSSQIAGRQAQIQQVKAANAQASATETKAAVPKEIQAAQTDFTPFAMFIGVSMCGTAFAVLARILSERNMFRIPLGLLLIACAAIDDIVAFTLLALSVALAGRGNPTDVILIVVKLIAFTVVLFAFVRPLLERWVLRPYRARGNKLGPEQLSILLAGLLLSSYITSRIGVHELIGSFLFGVAVPRRNATNLFHSIAERLEGVSVQLLLPVFFVIAGQGVNLLGLTTADILPALAILAVACIGKFAGGAVAARLTGVPRRQSLAVGTMMNTRGLAELVILQVGREAGVIDDKVYTMLVIMAVVTTAMAGPLLKWVYPDRWLHRDIAEADRKRISSATDRVAVVIDDVADALPLVELAAAYGGGRATGSVTLIRFTDQGAGLASFADDLAQLKGLRERVERAGLQCQVISRASQNRPIDVVAEVERLAPGAVVIGRSDTNLTGPLRHVGCDVLGTLIGLRDVGSVRAPGGNSNAELAAMELAVRIALHAKIPLSVSGPVSNRVEKQLRALGVDRNEPSDPALAVAIVGLAPDANFTVQPGERDRVSLVEALRGWTVRVEPIILSTV